jgi:hypothetical protein
MERIVLRVGNEKGEQALRAVSLRTYLAELRSFLHRPDGWAGTNSSLYDETRDSHVIVSAQACFLPVPQVHRWPTSYLVVYVLTHRRVPVSLCVLQGGEAKFNVNLYNYQSRTGDPAVLAIVATAQGTSAQIVNASGGPGSISIIVIFIILVATLAHIVSLCMARSQDNPCTSTKTASELASLANASPTIARSAASSR